MKYRATEAFWESFYDLPPAQKESVRRAWEIFKQDPFDPRLLNLVRARLSAIYRRTIYAVEVEGDLRVLFYMEGDTVWTVDAGTHEIYRR